MTSEGPFQWRGAGRITFQGTRELVNNEEMKTVAENYL